MSSHLHTKHFTLDQARRCLGTSIPLVEELVQLKSQLGEQGYDVYRHKHFGGMGPNGQKHLPAEMDRLIAILKELDGLGIIVKNLNDGLIDFPFLRSNGEEVYLCWKLGESEIYYWHTIADGFSGRKPIEQL